jgi:hypothetical protein
MKRIRFLAIISAAAMILAACGTAAGEIFAVEETPQIESSEPISSETDQERSSDLDCEEPFGAGGPQFPTSYWDKTNFCIHSIDYNELLSGGPPPDGIPAIDNPGFVTSAEADEWLEDVEPVIAFVVGEDARAYPLQIMTWHEIVNDTVGDVPVVVTFCPLCNTALVFERPEIDGERLTFGTSGLLRKSDLVMYDRQTESFWQQFSGEAIVGDLTGTQLQFLPAGISSWADFKTRFPEGIVLSRETGFNRSYGRNPYPGYDNINNTPFAFAEEPNGDILPMARVIGITDVNGPPVSYLLSRLEEERIINDRIEGIPLVVFWKSGTASALDSSQIVLGKDVGSVGVFKADLEGQVLTFESPEDGVFVDQETGSTWDIFGAALEGSLAGSQLEPIPHHSTFWFAWSAFENANTLQE